MAKVTLPGRPPGPRKPNRTGKPFWSETILHKGSTSTLECDAWISLWFSSGLVATFLGGCAEGPYVAAYDTGYYPAGYYRTYSYDYYGYPYSYYYGPTYDRTVVRSGVRYNDAYGPRYYGSTVYGDWY
jgi:hypothetical protein